MHKIIYHKILVHILTTTFIQAHTHTHAQCIVHVCVWHALSHSLSPISPVISQISPHHRHPKLIGSVAAAAALVSH